MRMRHADALGPGFRALFGASHEATCLLDLAEARFLDVNRAFEQLCGRSAATLLGRTVHAAGVLADQQQYARAMRRLHHGPLRDFPGTLRRADGTLRRVLASAFTLTMDHRLVVVATLQDVTESEAQARALRESSAKFAAAFQGSIDPMLISRAADGLLLDLNEAFLRLTGHTRRALVGRPLALLGLSLPDRPGREAAVRDAVQHLTTRSGEVRDVLLSASVIHIAGQPCHVSVLRDVTEKIEIERELIDLNVNLERRVQTRTAELERAMEDLRRAQRELVETEKLAALGTLLTHIAHEVGTPLGNCLTVASALRDQSREMARALAAGVTRSGLQRFLGSVDEAADLLMRNLERASSMMHSYKQVSADQASARRRTFVLGDMLRELAVTLSPQLRRSPWHLDLQVPEGVVMDSYPGALGQIVSNLLDNAIRHGFAGRDQGRVVVRARRGQAGWLELEVEDDGRGIAPEHLGHIFDEFFTTSAGSGGSGIGLYLVRETVEKTLGGRVEVHSTPGAGCAFILHLPLRAPEEAETPARRAPD